MNVYNNFKIITSLCVCVCIYIYVCLFVYMYMCVYMYVYGCMRMHVCICMCVYMYVYGCMRMHVCMYMYRCVDVWMVHTLEIEPTNDFMCVLLVVIVYVTCCDSVCYML